MELDPRATAAGVRLVAHEVLGSTNAEALALARQGERGPLWITAARQTAGRGRRGRPWVSEPGNLLREPPAHRSARPPSIGPSSRSSRRWRCTTPWSSSRRTLKPRLAIKWPNDLLLAGEKFAGILIEGEGGHDGAVAVGIGVNCASHPADTDQPATDLAAGGAQVSPQELFGALSAKMLGRLAQWNAGEGFATIRADWLARAAGVGEDIRVRLADREVSGRFEALDEAGSLVLRRADGKRETIAAGDVVLAPASSPSAGS